MKHGLSAACPGVSSSDGRRQRRSAERWSLLVSPLRDLAQLGRLQPGLSAPARPAALLLLGVGPIVALGFEGSRHHSLWTGGIGQAWPGEKDSTDCDGHSLILTANRP